ncbi:hypothetical protein ACFW5S_23290 [Streptomyces olivaceus]|uniref:hypothetical protein n=1 Tax=Streptomyces olivaceus TaxID=47716 RepID=UPI0036C97476
MSEHLPVVAGIVLVGAAATGLRSATNALAVTGAPENRGGAAPLVLSAQFFGGAVAATVWLPVHLALGDRGFALVAVVPVLSRRADADRRGGRPLGEPAGTGSHRSSAARALMAAGLRGLSTRST